MSTDAPSSPKPKRINLRRPDVMEQVKAQVLTHYRSDLVDRLRATGEVTSVAYGPVRSMYLASSEWGWPLLGE